MLPCVTVDAFLFFSSIIQTLKNFLESFIPMFDSSIRTEEQTNFDYVLLVLLAAIWGGSFMFIKVAVETIPPITITAGRITIAAALLYVAARMAGQPLPRDRRSWVLALGIAILGNALPFTLISWGEKAIDSGLASILMAIVPICTLIVVHFGTDDEKLSVRKLLGIAVGFSGVVVLIGADALGGIGGAALHQVAVASGAICYGMTALINKKLSNRPRRSTAASIMITSTIIMIPLSLIIDQPWTIDAAQKAIWSVIALGVLSTALAQIILLKIVRARGASFLALNNYMVPLFGLLWGVLFLAEQPKSTAIIGLALILCGITLSRKG